MAERTLNRAIVVYKVTNLVNGKLYFGIASRARTPERSVAMRWLEHVRAALSGQFDGHFQRAIRKYGPGKFSIVIVTECVDQREAAAVERGLIAQHGTMNPANGYNMSSGGEMSAGVARRPESLAKLSASVSEQWQDPEFRARMVEAFGRRVFPESHVEHLRRLAESQRGTKKGHGAKISASLMGHAVSAETRAKLSAANKGNPYTTIACEKAREANTGRKRSAEVRERIRQAALARWANPEFRASRTGHKRPAQSKVMKRLWEDGKLNRRKDMKGEP